MTWYELWLFLHIAAAAIWVGGGTMIQLFALPVLASGDAERLAEFARNVMRTVFTVPTMRAGPVQARG
jgi:uncharacterized membrane protein